ncbi:Mab-21 domain-containing protein [Meloidogyne graminicola]|uniref:Mab-21 domain-containing protein n=1 Tax=Meloidogyne graminicola TaxID=189291 RepID=A0A8T0A0J9_9BILA|nr:Mab-21 domain-containing protein [Meloidogyne graminicola]
MLCQSTACYQQINLFINDKVQSRKLEIQKTIILVSEVIQDVLKNVEHLEPRFISTFIQKSDGLFEGLEVHSSHEFEVILYLNQMGVFNFVDDVEFITASGYLSARKIRSRFQNLVAQTIEKPPFNEKCKFLQEGNEVKLLIYGKYIVQITCAFRCNGIWPRSANHWPNPQIQWPSAQVAKDVRIEGFNLLSKQLNNNNSTNNMMEGDAWMISMTQAENILLENNINRRRVFSILKTLRDRHLDFVGSSVNNYLIKNLVLYECEKHCSDNEWHDFCIGDRLIGILLQLVSCLQCRRCPHFFLPQLDLLRGKTTKSLDESARAVWALVRQLMLDVKSLERL